MSELSDVPEPRDHQLTDVEFFILSNRSPLVKSYLDSIQDPSVLSGKGGTVEGFISDLKNYAEEHRDLLGIDKDFDLSLSNPSSPLNDVYKLAINLSDESERQFLLRYTMNQTGITSVNNLNPTNEFQVDRYTNIAILDNGNIKIDKDPNNPSLGSVEIKPYEFNMLLNSVDYSSLPDGARKDELLLLKSMFSTFLPKTTVDDLPDGLDEKKRMTEAMNAFNTVDCDAKFLILEYAASAIDYGQLAHSYGTQAFQEEENTISPLGVDWAARKIVAESNSPSKK